MRISHLKLDATWSSSYADSLTRDLSPVGQRLELEGEVVHDVLVGTRQEELRVIHINDALLNSKLYPLYLIVEPVAPGHKVSEDVLEPLERNAHAESFRHLRTRISDSVRSSLQPGSDGFASHSRPMKAWR